jgi:hypothetical protein
MILFVAILLYFEKPYCLSQTSCMVAHTHPCPIEEIKDFVVQFHGMMGVESAGSHRSVKRKP